MPIEQPEMRRWVPERPSNLSPLDDIVDLLRHMRVVVLTGAGCSTESGIPDYRGPKRDNSHPEPITYQEYVGSRAVRRRYWARATLGPPEDAASLPMQMVYRRSMPFDLD